MKFVPLPQSFYEPSAELVAEKLLGHWLLRRTPEGVCGGPIVETEAYLVGDPASHGFAGLTARTRVMHGEPGRAYVYFIYGNHYCVNAVCRPSGHAEAVLIRAIEAEFGQALLRRNRPVEAELQLTNGPGKLCAAMQIDRRLDGASLCDADSPLIIAANPDASRFRQVCAPIIRTKRIGITKAAESPLRFYLDGSCYVSRKSKRL